MSDPYEIDPFLRHSIEGLNAEVISSDDIREGFLNIYHSLPEIHIDRLFGSDFIIGYAEEDTQQPSHLRPISYVKNHLVCRNLRGGRPPRTEEPDYVLFGNSVFIDRYDIEKYEWEDITQLVLTLSSSDQDQMIGTGVDGECFAASRKSICRDAFLTFSRGYSLGRLKGQDIKEVTADKGMRGSLITVHQKGEPVTIFFEHQLYLTSRVRGLRQRSGNKWTSLLSYVDPAT